MGEEEREREREESDSISPLSGRDGKYYLIDFSRTMPCVPPLSSHSHLFELFRPEFVKVVAEFHIYILALFLKKFAKLIFTFVHSHAHTPLQMNSFPLCPDAFSNFVPQNEMREM